MEKVRFIRSTDPEREGEAHKAGDVVEMAPSSARHWYKRNAAEPYQRHSTAIKTETDREQVVEEMQEQFAEIANAQPKEPKHEPVTPVAGALSNGGGDGDRAESVPTASGRGQGGKGSGGSRK